MTPHLSCRTKLDASQVSRQIILVAGNPHKNCCTTELRRMLSCPSPDNPASASSASQSSQQYPSYADTPA